MSTTLRRWLVALAAFAGLAVALGACSNNDTGGVIQNPGTSSTAPPAASSVP